MPSRHAVRPERKRAAAWRAAVGLQSALLAPRIW